MTGAVAGESGSSYASLQAAALSNSMQVLDNIAQSNLSGGSSGQIPSNLVISPFGELLVSLIQLQMENTQYFKQAAAKAAALAQSEAQAQNQEAMKQFLTKLAASLETASQDGKLPSSLLPQVTTSQAYTRTGQPVAASPDVALSDASSLLNLSNFINSLAPPAATVAADVATAATTAPIMAPAPVSGET